MPYAWVGTAKILPAVVLPVDEHVRVELVGVRQGADARVDVDDLVLRDQALAVGEGDREDVRQRAGRERGREGRGGPVVLLPVDRDPGVLGLELADLEIQGVDRFLRRARPQRADRDGHRLVGAVAARWPVAARRWRHWRCAGAGVLVAELQALTVTMAVATIASALSLRYGLAAISSLTSMCLLSLALASELQIPPQKAIPGPSLHPQSSSLCRAPEGAVRFWDRSGRSQAVASDGRRPAVSSALASRREQSAGSSIGARERVGDAHEPVAPCKGEHIVCRGQPPQATVAEIRVAPSDPQHRSIEAQHRVRVPAALRRSAPPSGSAAATRVRPWRRRG